MLLSCLRNTVSLNTALLVAMVSLSARAAEAQRSVAVGMGADIPIGGTADVFKSGYHSTVSVSFTPRRLRRVIRVDGSLTELRGRDSASTPHHIQSVVAGIVLTGPTRLTPAGYVVAGIGFYQQSNASQKRSDTGVNIGAGISFPRRVVGTFIEARLHYIGGGSRTKYFPMTIGLVF